MSRALADAMTATFGAVLLPAGLASGLVNDRDRNAGAARAGADLQEVDAGGQEADINAEVVGAGGKQTLGNPTHGPAGPVEQGDPARSSLRQV